MADTPPEPDKVIVNPDLRLVATKDLIEAIANRHADCCIIWCEGNEGSGQFRREIFRGNSSRLLGASERCYRRMIREVDRQDTKGK